MGFFFLLYNHQIKNLKGNFEVYNKDFHSCMEDKVTFPVELMFFDYLLLLEYLSLLKTSIWLSLTHKMTNIHYLSGAAERSANLKQDLHIPSLGDQENESLKFCVFRKLK